MKLLRISLLILASGLLMGGLNLPIIRTHVDYVDAIDSQIVSLSAGQIEAAIRMFVGPEIMLVYDRKISIIEGAKELWKSSAYISFSLVVFLSIIFPIGKILLFFIEEIISVGHPRLRMISEIAVILHKWSLLDVLVVSVIVVSLSGNPILQSTPGTAVFWYACYVFAILVYFRFRRSNGATDVPS